jgi:hypothetical protein
VAGGLNWALGTAMSVGLLVAYWSLLQHNVYTSNWGLDYQVNHQNWASAWNFVNAELFDPDLGSFFFVMSVLYATLGGTPGVLAARRGRPVCFGRACLRLSRL